MNPFSIKKWLDTDEYWKVWAYPIFWVLIGYGLFIGLSYLVEIRT